MGYTVVYGIIQLINFAHGEIFMIGAFGALAAWLLIPGDSLSLWMLPVMLLVGMAAAVGTSLLTERSCLPPAPQRTEAGAPDHRDRCISLPSRVHPVVLRAHTGLPGRKEGHQLPRRSTCDGTRDSS